MARTPIKKKKREPVEGRVYETDAIRLLQSLPDQSVDLIITDPAYESLEKWRATGTTTRLKKSKGSSNEWFKTFPNSSYPEFFRECYRVLKLGSMLYMFCDEETRDIVTTGFSPQSGASLECCLQTPSDILEHAPLLDAGFKYWKALIWDKYHCGMGYHWPAQHELIIMAERVVRKNKHAKIKRVRYPVGNILCGDVLRVPRLKGKKYYPTEKPQELIRLLIEASSEKGDTILDPFCGSGVVGQACAAMGRHYILGDLDTKEANRRLG